MQQELKDPNPKKRLDAALALAKAGNFEGLDTIVDCLIDKGGEVRIKAAFYCEKIGFAGAIEGLGNMALGDPVSDNRNQAIYALAGIGRPAVIPILIAALDDRDGSRRSDAQTALYWIIGREVLPLLADQGGTSERDQNEAESVATWWKHRSSGFDKDRVYYMGELASPGVYIKQLKLTKTPLPDAILGALCDWTGEDFGQKPLSKVIAQWEKWWGKNEENYVAGRRYFYGHVVTCS